MNTHPLFSAYLKYAWGRKYLKQLNDELIIRKRYPDWPFIMKKDFDAEVPCFRYTAVQVADLPDRWPLLVGDICNNLRGALDHLAWYLVSIGSTPSPLDPRKVQFPIYDTEAKFNSALGIRLPGVDTKAVDVIRQHQPFDPPHPPGSLAPLLLLADINREDKHRTVQTVLTQHFGELQGKIEWQRDFEARTIMIVPERIVRLKDGTEIVSVMGEVTGPNPDMKMTLGGQCSIAFENGHWVTTNLQRVQEAVEAVLDGCRLLLKLPEWPVERDPLQSWDSYH